MTRSTLVTMWGGPPFPPPRAIFLAALGLWTVGSGCAEVHECTLIGCADGVGVTLDGLATKLATSLPATLQVCIDATCSSFRLDHTGAAPACTSLSAGNTLCSVDGQGTIVLRTLPLPTGTADGATVTVHATATGKNSNVLYDQSTPVKIVASHPNGPDCEPTCHGGQATFGM